MAKNYDYIWGLKIQKYKIFSLLIQIWYFTTQQMLTWIILLFYKWNITCTCTQTLQPTIMILFPWKVKKNECSVIIYMWRLITLLFTFSFSKQY